MDSPVVPATIATEIMLAIQGEFRLPEINGFAQLSTPPARRLASEPWDRVDLNALLKVRDVRRINTDLGFLLRAYWCPATDLTFHQSSMACIGDRVVEFESVIDRTLSKCRADMLIWRDRIHSTMAVDGSIFPVMSQQTSGGDILHYYNRSEQTLRLRKSVSRDEFAPVEIEEARQLALSQMCFLHPIGPIGMGATWEGRTSAGHIRYELSQEASVGDTPVVIVRRDGWLNGCHASATLGGSWNIQRQGLSVFAYNRSVLLEDRQQDQYSDPNGVHPGMTVKTVTRLIRSAPRSVRTGSAPQSVQVGS